MTKSTTITNSQHNLTDMDLNFVDNMDPNFLECVQPHMHPTQVIFFILNTPAIHLSNAQSIVMIPQQLLMIHPQQP